MKTNKINFTLSLIFITLLTVKLGATSIKSSYSDESYINDIPFDTEAVADESTIDQLERIFDFSDEAEVKDHSSTANCVTPDCRYENAITSDFEMSEEEYINDIPFSTETISENLLLIHTIHVDFEEEVYINDIPFNTFIVVEKRCCSLMCSK